MMKKMILLAALAVFNSINFVNAQITSIDGKSEVCNYEYVTHNITLNSGQTLKTLSVTSDNTNTSIKVSSDNKSFNTTSIFLKEDDKSTITVNYSYINTENKSVSDQITKVITPKKPEKPEIYGQQSIYCLDESNVQYTCTNCDITSTYTWTWPPNWVLRYSNPLINAEFTPTKGISGDVSLSVINKTCNNTSSTSNVLNISRPNQPMVLDLMPTTAVIAKPVIVSVKNYPQATGYTWTTDAPSKSYTITTSTDKKTATFVFNIPSDRYNITVKPVGVPDPCGATSFFYNIRVYCPDEKLVPECSIKPLISDFGTLKQCSDMNVNPRFMEDVNKDGKVDIVAFKPNGVVVSLNNGFGSYSAPVGLNGIACTSFGSSQGWTNQETYPRSIADVDGDGYKDIVGFGIDGVYVAINKKDGTGTFNPAVKFSSDFAVSTWTNQTKYPRIVKDVNGDGKVDIVGFGAQGVYLSTGDGKSFSPIDPNKPDYMDPYTVTYSGFGYNQGWTNNTIYPRDLIDMDNDGLLDIVAYGTDRVYVAKFFGVKSFAGVKLPAFSLISEFNLYDFCVNKSYSDMLNNPRFMIDMNKDKYPDLVGFRDDGVYVALNNSGIGFLEPTMWTKGYGKINYATTSNSYFSDFNTNPRLLGDINGDGYPDIVGFHTYVVCVSLNNAGKGFNCAEFKYLQKDFTNYAGWTSQSQFPRFLVDIDGDNRKEIVGFAAGGVVTNNCSSNESSAYFRKDNSTELNTIESIKCYPNPANDVLNFEIPVNEDLVSLLIFDSMGNKIKEVSNTEFANGLFVLNTNNLNAGLYTYQVVINNSVIKSDKVLIIK